MSTLERAISFAADWHEGQVDKSGQPYILHPLRVMLAVQAGDARITAVLHDVIEDTDAEIFDLYHLGFNERVIHAVDALTRRSNETYQDFICRVATNPLATEVKIQDIYDNLRPGCPPGLEDRYRKALGFLE